MSLLLNDDQRALQTTVRDFFSTEADLSYVRKRLGQPSGDRELWQKFAALGVASLWEGEESAGFRALALVASEAGRALAPLAVSETLLFGPFLSTTIAPAEREKLASFAAWQASKVSSGTLRVGLLQNPDGASHFCADADQTPIVGMLRGGHLTLSAVRQVKAHASLDLTLPFFSVEADGGSFTLSGEASARLALLYAVLKASEIAGACGRVVEMTTEYVKTRKQFGAPIGSFQAVAHRVADMYLWSEAIDATAAFAAWAADDAPAQLPLAASAALSFACEYGPRCIETAIQMHGGIGFTWEHDLHLFLRRVRTVAALHAPQPEALVERAYSVLS